MYKILIGASIGIVLILCLRTHKQNETIPIFKYEEREEIYNGDSTTYLRFTRTPEDKQRKDCKSINTN